MILDEFTGRNCKRTEYIDASGKHWIVRTDPVFRDHKLVCYETVLLLQLDYCNKRHGLATSATKERAYLKHDGFVARLQRAEEALQKYPEQSFAQKFSLCNRRKFSWRKIKEGF